MTHRQMEISSIVGTTAQTALRGVVHFGVSPSYCEGKAIVLETLVLSMVTTKMPSTSVTYVTKWKHLIKLQIADPDFATPRNEQRAYMELKQEIWFEEYLLYVNGAHSVLILNFCLGTHWLFKELGRHVKRGGSQCPNCGACKESVECVVFECASYDFQRLDF